MNLFSMLNHREAGGQPIRVGMIGAGKFGSMYAAQAVRTPGIHLAAIVDLDPSRARENLSRVGWDENIFSMADLETALQKRGCWITDNAAKVIEDPRLDVIVECTGHPSAAIEHCLMAFAAQKDIINVTVEADAFCGPILAQKAREAGVIYSLAYGDQPALACELVDWARTSGFPVIAAGRGHKWLPHYRQSTPETVWDHWGLTAEQAARGGLNPKMFNAFLDGSKPAIECAAIANATGLYAPQDGLSYPPGSADDIPTLMRPKELGGVLERRGLVECVSSITREGVPIANDLRKGVWVSIEADTDYIKHCFEEYKVVTDPSGRFMSAHKKWHLIGLELGVSVASVVLRREATGNAVCFHADAVARTKRPLAKGELLDGEGGTTVAGHLMNASDSLARNALPLGLAHDVVLIRNLPQDAIVTWDDVHITHSTSAMKLRKELENSFKP